MVSQKRRGHSGTGVMDILSLDRPTSDHVSFPRKQVNKFALSNLEMFLALIGSLTVCNSFGKTNNAATIIKNHVFLIRKKIRSKNKKRDLKKLMRDKNNLRYCFLQRNELD